MPREDCGDTQEPEQCGVASLAERDIRELNTIATRSMGEIFDEESFECLFCPQNLLKNEFYQRVGFLFGNLCDMFSNYLKNHYYMNIPTFVYSFLVCEDGNIRGGCGAERLTDAINRFKLYINPLFCNESEDDLLTFVKIMNIANHEVCHVFLHHVDPIKYDVKLNYHGPEFFQIFSEIDEFFYDKKLLMQSLWIDN
jgi:hypothetical protein